MHRWSPLGQLILARLREFFREPEALFWVYGFPLLMAVGLGIAFANREPEPPAVDVEEGPEAIEIRDHLQEGRVHAEVHSAEECRQRLRFGKTVLYVVSAADGFHYVFDPTRPESVAGRYQVDDLVQRWKSNTSGFPTADVRINEIGSRYIDFLLPGLMGMNLMGGGLWGVGFTLVDMRARKLLKRLLATPMRRSDFLLSLIIVRLLLAVPEMTTLILVGTLGFGVPLGPSPLTLLLVLFIGCAAFSGIGLLIASRTEKPETVTGLINLVILPMWLFSGVFFSSRRFPDVAQPFIQALPLTQLNDALREVMLEGKSVSEVSWRLGILAAYGAFSFLLALRWFRWS
jgi:ABC transporter DrrB family efflux protein